MITLKITKSIFYFLQSTEHTIVQLHIKYGNLTHATLRHLAQAVFTAVSSTKLLPPLSTLCWEASHEAQPTLHGGRGQL